MTLRKIVSAGFSTLAVSAWMFTLPATGHAADTTKAAAQSAAEPKGLEDHIKNLHTQLAITPDEEPAWATFVQTMRTNATSAEAAAKTAHEAIGTASAPEIMKSYADLAHQRGQDLESLASAFATLYNTFPAAQKQAADQSFRENGHGGMGGGHGHH